MKLAIATDGENVFPHFGMTPAFEIVEIEEGKVVSKELHDNGGISHRALVGVLSGLGANALIVGGLGGPALSFLNEAGIVVYAPVSGSVEEAIEAFLAGNLQEADPAIKSQECRCGHHEA